MEINDFISKSAVSSTFLLAMLVAFGVLICILTVIYLFRFKKASDREKVLFSKFLNFSTVIFVVLLALISLNAKLSRKVSPDSFVKAIEEYTGETVVSELTTEDIRAFIYEGRPIFILTEKTETYVVPTATDTDVEETEENNIINEQDDNNVETRVVKKHFMLLNNDGYVEFYVERQENFFQRYFFK